MNNVTRNDVWELAKSRRNDLVKLASDLIRIPSENPVGTQRDVIDFVEKYLSDAGISYDDPDMGIVWPFEKIGGIENMIISEKDKNLMSLKEYLERIK